MLDLARFQALTFDCYGTLIDWESGILAALRPVVTAHGVSVGDEELLSLYGELESAEEAAGYRAYRDVLAGVMDRMADRLGFKPTAADRDALAASLPGWPPFADTVEALGALARRYDLGVLSNIDRDLFARTAERLGVAFRWVVTAQDVGAYKPSARFFEAAEQTMGVPRDRWLHVAQSRFHDVAPASAFGLTTVHVDRRHGRTGGGATPASEATASMTVPDLATLIAALPPV